MHDEHPSAPLVLCEGFAPPPSVIERYYNTRYFKQPTRASTTDQQPDGRPASDEQYELYIHFHNNGSEALTAQCYHPRNAEYTQLTAQSPCCLSCLVHCAASIAVIGVAASHPIIARKLRLRKGQSAALTVARPTV